MTLYVPFGQGQRVVELGGGNKPMFHPNVDCAPGPVVDIVTDFNKPLPLPSIGFDGVFSKYSLEHISWRKLRQFISEMYRILRPGGTAFVITANLLEQCRALVEAPSLNDDLVCMIFGGQNTEGDDWYHSWYPEAHHCGLSPEYAERLFKAAGFLKVEVSPLPECKTDMVIVAHKSSATIGYGLGR